MKSLEDLQKIVSAVLANPEIRYLEDWVEVQKREDAYDKAVTPKLVGLLLAAYRAAVEMRKAVYEDDNGYV